MVYKDASRLAPAAPARRSRGWRVLKILLIGALIVFLAMSLGLAIPIMREFTRPIAPPSFERIADTLLVYAQNAGGKKPTISPGAGATTTMLSSASVASTATLRFKPFIPDAPDLPAELRQKRAELNARFDRDYREIEEYERIKESLSPRQRSEKFDSILKTSGGAWGEIIRIHGNSFSEKGWTGEVCRRSDDFAHWEMAEQMEIHAQGGNWLAAANYASHFFDMRRFDWQRHSRDPMKPFFQSDYFRENDSKDWDRIIYCYRQVGGAKGYGLIAATVWRREKEWLGDALGRAAWRVSSSGSRR